jgi:hypothetical protein
LTASNQLEVAEPSAADDMMGRGGGEKWGV